MNSNRPYFTSNNQTGRESLYGSADGDSMNHVRDNIYFYTICVASAIVAIYILFYILRQYEFSFVYGDTLDKIAKYLPGIKQTRTIKT